MRRPDDESVLAWTVLTFAAFVTLLLLFGCSTPRDISSDVEVCVRNTREHNMRVEIRSEGTGQEFGEIQMMSFTTRCEDMPIPPSATIFGVIKSVSVARDVAPPGWRHQMVTDGMTLIVGSDGLTPFAHSGRIR